MTTHKTQLAVPPKNRRIDGLKISVLGLGLILGVLATLPGCSPSPAGSTATTFTEVYNASFSVTCVNCHNPGHADYADTGLDFTNGDTAYNTMVNVLVSGPANPTTCGTVRRVNPGSAATSYLLGVLFSQDNTNNFAGVTNCRPPNAHIGYSNLSQAERTSIIAWINNGANR